MKTREVARIVILAEAVAVGVNTDSQHEVLGVQVVASKAKPFWTEFLRLNRRHMPLEGLQTVSDAFPAGLSAMVR